MAGADGAPSWRAARPWLWLAAAATVVAATLPLWPLAAEAQALAGNLVQLGAASAAVAMALRRARRLAGRKRAGWTLFAFAAGSWAVGQAIWTWHETAHGVPPPSPGSNDAAYLLLYPFAVAGVLLLSPLIRQGARTGAMLLEGALFSLTSFVLAWPFLLDPAFDAAGPGAGAYVAFAYPVADLALLGLAGAVMLRGRGNWRSSLGVAYAAFWGLFVADLAWATGFLDGTYATGDAADAGWVLAFLGLAAAAAAPAPSVQAASEQYVQRVGLILPIAAVIVAVASFILVELLGSEEDPAWLAAMAAVLVLSFVHQGMAAREVAGMQAGAQRLRQQYLDLVESSPEGIVQTSPEGRILLANPAFARLVGYASAEALRAAGLNVRDLYAEPTRRDELLAELGQKGRVIAFPIDLRRRDGQLMTVSANLNGVRGPDGRLLRIEGFLRDVTEEQRLARDLQRSQRTVRVVSRGNQALIRASDEGMLMHEVCDILVRDGGYRAAWIGFADDAPGKPVRPVAKAGFLDHYLEEARITWDADDPRGQGPTGRAIRSLRPQASQEILHDPDMEPWRKAGHELGFASSCALGLDLGGPRGALMVYATEPSAFGGQEVALLEELAGDVAFGIRTLRERARRASAEQAAHEASERLAAMVASSHEAIFGVGLDGRVQSWNPGAQDIFGFTAGEAIGRSVDQLMVPPDRRAEGEEMLRLIRRGEGMDRRDAERVHKDGRRIVVSVTLSAVRDRAGNLVGGAVTAFDVTEVRRAAEVVRRSEERLKEAQALAKVGSWELDLKANALWWSDETYRVFGVQPGAFDASYESFLSTVHPDDRGAVDKAYKDSVANRTPYSIEHRLQLPDGSIKWVHERCETSYGPDGKPVRSIGTTQDITERKLADAAREALAAKEREVQRLQELNKMRMEFLNTAAHDLKTPLTPLKLQMATLRLRPQELTPRQKESLELMERNLNRFQMLVEDMLDAARLQSGRLRLRREPVPLAPLLEEAVASFQESARLGRIEVHVAPAADLRIDADPTKAMQVVMNLVSNAVKYTPPGGRVDLSLRGEDGLAHVEVRDTGLGMTAEQLGRLFQPFVRLHEDVKGVAKGTGLGLYISKGIVEQHGGRIWAESAGPGQGSAFHVAWPVAKATGKSGPGPAAAAPNGRRAEPPVGGAAA